MREKLIELIGKVQDYGCDLTDVVCVNHVENDALADYLIANGVTIPTRCKDCKKEWCYLRQELGADGYCSGGEKKTNDSD